MDQDRKLHAVSTGKMAEVAYAHFHGLIEQYKAELVSKLTGDYRNGKVDAVLMASHVSAMCALDDLDKRALRAIQVGRKVEKEMVDSGSNEPA